MLETRLLYIAPMLYNAIQANILQVQTGDVVDRGPDTQKLYKWMRKLTEQAAEQGGKVVKLWGYYNPKPYISCPFVMLILASLETTSL